MQLAYMNKIVNQIVKYSDPTEASSILQCVLSPTKLVVIP